MGKFDHDSDDDRLGYGIRATEYDADTGRHTYRNVGDSEENRRIKARRCGHLLPVCSCEMRKEKGTARQQSIEPPVRPQAPRPEVQQSTSAVSPKVSTRRNLVSAVAPVQSVSETGPVSPPAPSPPTTSGPLPDPYDSCDSYDSKEFSNRQRRRQERRDERNGHLRRTRRSLAPPRVKTVYYQRIEVLEDSYGNLYVSPYNSLPYGPDPYAGNPSQSYNHSRPHIRRPYRRKSVSSLSSCSTLSSLSESDCEYEEYEKYNEKAKPTIQRRAGAPAKGCRASAGPESTRDIGKGGKKKVDAGRGEKGMGNLLSLVRRLTVKVTEDKPRTGDERRLKRLETGARRV